MSNTTSWWDGINAQADAYIAHFPEKLKPGLPFIDESDPLIYLSIAFASMVFFYILFWIVESVMVSNDYFDKSYLTKSNDEKYWRI